MANDLVTVWGGSLRIGRAPANSELLVGNGADFTLQTVAITIDNILGSTRGSIAYRSATQWTQLVPGTANNVLQTNGAGADPTWATPDAVVNNALGGSDGAIAYKAAGDWTALSIGSNTTVLSSTGTAPTWVTAEVVVNTALGGSDGAIAYKAAGDWTALSIGSNTTVLSSTGTAPTWVTAEVVVNNALGGSDGAIAYKAAGDWTALSIGASTTVLSSTGTAPTWVTAEVVVNNALGGSDGAIAYKAAGDWTALSIGSNTTVLSSTGTAPSWVTAETVVNNSLGGSNGSIAYKNAGDWTALSIGSANTILASNGLDPAWTTITNAIDNGTGGISTLGDLIYRNTTSYDKLTIGVSNTILTSVTSGLGNVPSWQTVSNLFDALFSSTRQTIITRASSSWAGLTPSATPYLILTNNTGNTTSDIAWGTLTGIIDNATTGTAFLGSMIYRDSTSYTKLTLGASNTILSSNGSAPAWVTTTSNLDATMGSTVGGLLVRSSLGFWTNLGAGAQGYFLQGQGSGVNPSFVKAFTIIVKSAAQNILSTGFVDDSELKFSVDANSVYSFTGNALYFFNTGGYKFAVNGPSGSTIVVETNYGSFNGSAGAGDVTAASNAGSATNAVQGVFFRGILYTGVTAGTFAVRNALNAATVASSALAGGYIEYAKAG